MKIPEKLKEILEGDQGTNGIIQYTLSQYGQILEENQLYFFEEYTDHGIKHIESVLKSSDNLITPTTYSNILSKSSISIGVYILSVILHDIGMHIRPPGLKKLIDGDFDDIRERKLDNKTWKELWNEYLDEARRYGDNGKRKIIGNPDWQFRVPDLENSDKLTGEDKKLIGEFIRRHHPRIAHEIALKGFPTENNNIPFASDLNYELRDISGLIARSHGVNIRSFFTYLNDKYHDTWIKPFNIEVIYLMVLIRVADYFQIDSNRIPEVTVKLKHFHSPISLIEHQKHLDVKFVQTFNKDPETIIFQCDPRNSFIFIKLSELFKDIQKELDISWAILGEIYGKEDRDNQPAIAYRRVKSNIDDVTKFSKNVNYIPEKINFNVSNELPKLLIGPLYGNDPTYGVRELLQNAVDSCREREFLEQGGYEGKIEIILSKEKPANSDDENKFYFEIHDNGLGMNLHVIKNYFLQVGSSLRKSSLWKKNFSDESGKSKIQRSGKFGIGVLAAFLIGDKISVKTKDANSSFGFFFKTSLNTEQIEVHKDQKIKVGTVIKIQISKHTIKSLDSSNYSFDKWYTHNSPKVEYFDKTNTFENLGYELKAPGYNDQLTNNWHELNIENYEKIIWTYNENFWTKSLSRFANNGELTCNGILIPEAFEGEGDYYDRDKKKWINDLNLPYISVFDFSGTLPLNLSRNKLDRPLPFKKNLQKEIYKDLIAKVLTSKIPNPFLDKNQLTSKKIYHPAIESVPIIYCKNGFILDNEFFLNRHKNDIVLKISPKKETNFLDNLNPKDSFIYILTKDTLSMSSFQYQANIYYLKKGAKVFIKKKMYEKLFDSNYNRYPLSVRRKHMVINKNDENIELKYKYTGDKFTLEDLGTIINDCNYIFEMKISDLIKDDKLVSHKIFHDLLENFIGENTIIPYEIEERKILFKKAFNDLDNYMQKYLA